MPTLLVGFVIFAAVIYFLFGLHEAKWRFTSMPEMLRIIRASVVLAISLVVLDYILFVAQFLRHVLLRQDHDRASIS